MIEQNILGLHAREGSQLPPGEDRHDIAWSEIVARLSAARDLRRVLAFRAPAVPGSFAPQSACRMAAREQGIRAVNPMDLGNRKANGATIVGIVDEASPAS
jgi:hypothetical protein